MRSPEELTLDERQSHNFKLTLQNISKSPAEPLTPSSVKVIIYVPSSSSSPVYVNSRDGNNTAGVSFSSGEILFHMSPEDNQIVDSGLYARSGYETHVLRVEIYYNGGTDRYNYEKIIKVRDLAHQV